MKKPTRKKTGNSKTRSRARAPVRMAKGDIVQLILEDHKPLKRLVRILKSEDGSLAERQKAFKEFAPLLISHAKPEEETLYMAMKDLEKLRSEGFEGDVEHGLADQMVEEAKRASSDSDLWTAKVKVLAELVEHHIKEEEEDMLPDFKKYCDSDERVELGARYRELRARLLDQGGMDALPEAMLKPRAKEQEFRH